MRKFDLGDIVYVMYDDEEVRGIIVSITQYLGGSVTYGVKCGFLYEEFYAQEITSNKSNLSGRWN